MKSNINNQRAKSYNQKVFIEMGCDRCSGEGGWIDFDSEENTEVFFQCPDCNGTGMKTNKTNKHENRKPNPTTSDSKHSITTSSGAGSNRK